jgi:hypothetical protein
MACPEPVKKHISKYQGIFREDLAARLLPDLLLNQLKKMGRAI